MRSLLWLGPLVDEAAMLREPAVSPAANRWQSGLIQALVGQGVQVTVIGYVPRPMWPRTAIRVAPSRVLLPAVGVEARHVGYWNAPILRERSWRRGLVREIREAASAAPPFDAVLTYNALDAFGDAGSWAQRHLGVPWVPIIADVPDADAMRASMSSVPGAVYLSWHAYGEAGVPRKLHLDGGVQSIPQWRPRDGRKVILYTGAMTPFGGVGLLAEAFARVRDREAELWICGKGRNAQVDRAAALDGRIKVLGMVPEERLVECAAAATLTVNPRPSHIEDSKFNFPSKVLEYLTYGRPVVSTWTPGLAPEYRDVLVVPEAESSVGLAMAMERVLEWTAETEREQFAKAATFLESRRWEVQAGRLLEWLGTVSAG